jgi:pimeloyl-ACP methyl ester carboxylesterase
VVIPGTAHLLNKEKPEVFNQAVLTFLRQVSP